MLRILLVESDQGLRQMATLCLENECQAEVVEISGVEGAKEALTTQEFHLFVIAETFPVRELVEFAEGQGLDSRHVGVIILGDHEEDLGVEVYSWVGRQQLTSFLPEKINRYAEEKGLGAEVFRLVYCRVKLETLIRLNFLNCDLYLKLNEKKYIKIMRAGDSFGESDCQKYQSKGVTYAFIRQEDYPKFVADFLENLVGVRSVGSIRGLSEKIENEELKKEIEVIAQELESAQSNKDQDFDYSRHVSERALSSIHKAIHQFGVTEEIQVLTKASVSQAVETISKIPKLSALFDRKSEDEGSREAYVKSHSVQLAHVSCMIASMMTFTSDLTRHKLCLAAFIHDVNWEDPDLARVLRLEEAANLGKEEMAKIRSHPEKAASLVREFSEIPPDVDTIVYQHHERPDGSGFPHQLNYNRIHPLSSIFIVSHDLIRFMSDTKKMELDVDGFLKLRGEEYDRGYFKKVVACLRENFSKIKKAA